MHAQLRYWIRTSSEGRAVAWPADTATMLLGNRCPLLEIAPRADPRQYRTAIRRRLTPLDNGAIPCTLIGSASACSGPDKLAGSNVAATVAAWLMTGQHFLIHVSCAPSRHYTRGPGKSAGKMLYLAARGWSPAHMGVPVL